MLYLMPEFNISYSVSSLCKQEEQGPILLVVRLFKYSRCWSIHNKQKPTFEKYCNTLILTKNSSLHLNSQRLFGPLNMIYKFINTFFDIQVSRSHAHILKAKFIPSHYNKQQKQKTRKSQVSRNEHFDQTTNGASVTTFKCLNSNVGKVSKF